MTTARMLEEMMVGYEQALQDATDHIPHRPSQVKAGLRDAVKRTWKHLARERMEHTQPTLPAGADALRGAAGGRREGRTGLLSA